MCVRGLAGYPPSCQKPQRKGQYLHEPLRHFHSALQDPHQRQIAKPIPAVLLISDHQYKIDTSYDQIGKAHDQPKAPHKFLRQLPLFLLTDGTDHCAHSCRDHRNHRHTAVYQPQIAHASSIKTQPASSNHRFFSPIPDPLFRVMCANRPGCLPDLHFFDEANKQKDKISIRRTYSHSFFMWGGGHRSRSLCSHLIPFAILFILLTLLSCI